MSEMMEFRYTHRDEDEDDYGYDEVKSTWTTFKEEALTLDQVLFEFRAFLVAAGYGYVEEVTITKTDGETLSSKGY